MYRRLCLPVALLIAFPLLVWAASPEAPLPSETPRKLGLAPERLERVSAQIQADVEAGRIVGATALIARRGRVGYFEAFGQADREESAPMRKDAIFRIYSMSKPITSVALMMLHEEGKFQLRDPVEKYLPEFEGVRVMDGARLVEPKRKPTIQDLLRHTAGLTYGIFGNTEVDKRYREAKILSREDTVAEMTEKLGKLPLLYHPGSRWHYSVANDVQGRLIEALSGETFGEYLQARIFEPLGMVDTGFQVPAEKVGRFAQMYQPTKASRLELKTAPPRSSIGFLEPVAFQSGGGGLVSTTADYLRFCQMLLNGGELDGVRLLGRKTVELMTRDHLTGVPEASVRDGGYGFGLGVAVHLDPGKSGSASSPGEYRWGGAAGTQFWIDPEEEMIGIYMVQILPHNGLSYGRMFKQLAYQAIVD